MDTDSPPNRTGEGSDEEEESSYNADLLELEPLREDSEDLLDDGNGIDNDNDNDDAASEQQNTDDEKQDGEQEESSSGSGDEDEDEDDDDAHVQGLTSNEREILTLLAVDKKLASLLELAASALSALRPTDSKDDSVQITTGETSLSNDKTASKQNQTPSQHFETASSEYYKALDDIQLTLRNSIHLIRKARISPRTLMENPALGSVLANGPGESNTTDSKDKVNIAPGVVADKSAGLSRGAQRMELETWKEGINALKKLLGSLDMSKSQNRQYNEEAHSTSNGD